MASVFDVARYILETAGAMTHMKLQKLVYYSQAWHAVWCEEQLFEEKIKAWANGPVVPSLFFQLQGHFIVAFSQITGDISNLSPEAKDSINRVIDFYRKYDPQQLSEMTHNEPPWKCARVGLRDGERGDKEITLASMVEYYSGL